MSFETIRLFFALLAILANAVTIGIVAIGFAGSTKAGAELRQKVFSAFAGLELWMAFAVAATATLMARIPIVTALAKMARRAKKRRIVSNDMATAK